MKKYAKTAILLTLSMLCSQSFFSCGVKRTGNGTSGAGDGIQQTTTADEAELGVYVLSESGVKLYYDESEFSEDFDTAGIAAALEKYFTAYANADYDSYIECLYPEYVTEMEKFLNKDYGYGLDTSFESQCENLKENAGGDFNITRLKFEAPEEDNSKEYLDSLGEIFENDFYETVKSGSDAIHDLIFYVMVECDGEETLLVSQYEIVFAEKDGRFYAFG